MLKKQYDSKIVEKKIYKYWEDNNFFKANYNSTKIPYTVMMPPPNITGNLHMGHALDNTLQDILIRFKRMCGFEVLWLPGTDHAAIATEAKIVEQMKKENITKKELGRENFMKRAYAWKEKYGNNICDQIKKLGASCDWSRERFTMGEKCSKAVIKFFVHLYEKNLIYRGERIVNWCPYCLTSISDAEVDFSEHEGNLWHIKYFLKSSDEFITIATTRPETIFGDTAIAINPSDKRYKNLIGQKVIVPICNREVLIIGDEYVEKDFGTGMLKVTPAHSFDDFEIGQRHNLEVISIINEKGFLNEKCCHYSGIERNKARETIVKDLEKSGLITKIEKITHRVGTCYRCNTVIEPIISEQWFVKMQSFAKSASEIIKTKDIEFVPEKFSKVHLRWMENIKDWCISRQLWWGHRIPAWNCEDCKKLTVSCEVPINCKHCDSQNIKQDEDSLDTWFSSALWPFSTLGWPKKTKDLDFFYPTDTLVTGYDIIFFWVSRMIFSALELTGTKPFNKVLIHGLVRDEKGQKMSKSLGNGIDPIKVIAKYGADALRFALVTRLTLGNDTRISDQKLESSRNFINKIWNAARFLSMNTELKVSNEFPLNNSIHHSWIISRFNSAAKEIYTNIENFEFGLATQKIYSFFWDEFCDWYLEIIKIDFADIKKHEIAAKISVKIFSQILKIAHPFVPFVTEEIWQTFKNESKKALIISDYPVFDISLKNENAEIGMNKLMHIIKEIRKKRSEMSTPPGKKINIFIEINKDKDLILKNIEIIKFLAKINNIGFELKYENCEVILIDFAKIYIPTSELIDEEKLQKRFISELGNIRSQIDKNKALIQNSEFVTKAPKDVVKKVYETLENLEIKAEKLRSEIKH
ncbi:MAG: valine--tRNA ligase [Oscillospiraceae bacterium]|jgi:valyl-tRNA synthetase|nr:valine--tRNA ligase [Oscillospiraceae bacterium]